MQSDCFLCRIRVVFPSMPLAGLIITLYEGHQEVVCINSLARFHLWCPNVDKDIDNVTSQCDLYQQKALNLTKNKLLPGKFPTRPWQRINIDFAGPIFGFTWYLNDDAFFKYCGAIALTTTTVLSKFFAFLQVFLHLRQFIFKKFFHFTNINFTCKIILH